MALRDDRPAGEGAPAVIRHFGPDWDRLARRVLVRAPAAALLALLTVVLSATPAAAHGPVGPQPTDFDTRVRGIEPAITDITARALDFGNRIELRNPTAREITVLGYQGEPYLRIGPLGVYENRRSPAVFLNRSRVPTQRPPRAYDPGAPHTWHEVSSGHVYRWHDHRAHWMGPGDPPDVARDPSHRHVVIRDFHIPLVVGGRPAAIVGDVVWAPGPSPWPWVGLAVGVAALVLVASRTRAWPWVLAVALLAAAAGETVHVVGDWGFSTAAFLPRALANVYSLGGIALALAAAAWLVRREPWDAVPGVLVAGLFILVAGGLAGITALTRSQLPSTLPDPVTRALVSLALGLGAGIVAASSLRLRASALPRAPTSPRATTPVEG